jgi:hypothetical protein
MSTKEGVRPRAIHLPKQQIILGDQKVVRLVQKLGARKPDAHRIVDPNVLTFVERWVAADREHEGGQWLAGEIYWLYFQAESEIQAKFVELMAGRNQLEIPDPSLTPRRRLIVALCGRNPDDIEDGGGKYDSRAGKRITAAIRAYEERAGIRKAKRKKRVTEYLPRTTKMFLAGLLEVAKDDERAVIEKLIIRKYGKKAGAALPEAA